MTIHPDGPRPGTDPVLDLSATPRTEERNPRTTDLDLLPTPAVLALLHAEDALVPAAVESVLGTLAGVVDEAAERIRRGGRVHYFGAGSSGRIAVLDAIELVPTFGLAPGIVIAHLAGGGDAMERAVEGAEDDTGRGQADAAGVTAADLVLGLSASGRTPYVAGALTAATGRGAFTVLVTCNPGSPLRSLARAAIVADTGPEAIAGSTRLKATSALKLILNSFSTALMVRLGKTYSNLMVEVSATNDKLRVRKVRILREASGADDTAAVAALAQADGDLRTALVALLAGVAAERARQALGSADGSVRGALTALGVARLHSAGRRRGLFCIRIMWCAGGVAGRERALLRHGRVLEGITLGWNVAGIVVLAVAAVAARSVALAGFGLDSLIEIGASVVVLWELSGTGEDRQRRALRLIGGAFLALAAYLTIQSLLVLADGYRAGHSVLGIAWTAVTAAVMFALAAGKARTGNALGNPVLTTEGRVTLVDGILAVAVLAGLAMNAAAGWWWADPAAALVIVFYALREAREIFLA